VSAETVCIKSTRTLTGRKCARRHTKGEEDDRGRHQYTFVYAHRSDSEWHEPARECIRNLAEGRISWSIPWPCVHEFLSIVTHPRIYDPPSHQDAAIDQVDAWLNHRSWNCWLKLKRIGKSCKK
jgi:hypothetical protein